MRKGVVGSAVLLWVIVLAGCDSFQNFMNPPPMVQRGAESGGIAEAQAVPYNGPRARIAVLDFEQKAAQGYAQIGQGMADMLATELVNTNRYIVLERQKLAGVLAEQDLARTGRIQAGTGAPTGQVEGAELLVTGAITEFEPNYQGGGLGLGGIRLGHHRSGGGGIGLGLKQAYVALDLRVIDTRTSRIVAATSINKKTTDISASIGGFGGGHHSLLGIGFGAFKNTPMEKAVRECLGAAVQFVVDRTPANYYHYNEAGQAIGAAPAPTPPAVTPTPTPVEPQSTPATPTPAQPAAQPAQVFVSVQSANVCEKADPNSTVVGVAMKGVALRVQGQDNTWYYVTLPDGKMGWVLKALTSTTAPQ